MRRVALVVGLVVAMLATTVSAAFAAPTDRFSSRAKAESALRTVQDLFAGRGVRTGRELTPALADLAKRRDALSASDRRKANDFLARPDGEGGADQFGDDYGVTEETPFCTTNFCVHYVDTTEDAPTDLTDTDSDGFPNYVEQMAAEFEFTFTAENTDLGWAEPKSDGTKGPDTGKTDVYIAQIGDDGIFGYAATDPEDRTTTSAYGYLVMDNDYSFAEFGYPDPLDPLKVTAAHEYNHVLQFTYDWIQDKWMLESTATWMEEQVYPAINDYINYLPSWANCTEPPVTQFDPPGTSCDVKVYGTAVWNHLLAAIYGEDVVRQAWEVSDSTTPDTDFAPAAYDEAIIANTGPGFSDDFGFFAATVAEWQTPGSPYPDKTLYPDVERIAPSLVTSGPPRTETLDHTSFRFIDVTPDSTQTSIELRADTPPGMAGTLALVGREGADPEDGAVAIDVQPIPANGFGAAHLDNPGDYGRITAVLVNADPSQAGFDNGTGDWVFTRDGQAFSNIQVVPTGTPRNTGGGGNNGGNGGNDNPPPPPPPAAALTSKFSLKRTQKLAAALKKGVLTSVNCSKACKVKVELRLDKKTAKKLKLKRVVGTKTVTLTKAGTKAVRVKLSKKARGKFKRRKSVKLTAVMRATSAGSAAKQRTAKVTLKR